MHVESPPNLRVQSRVPTTMHLFRHKVDLLSFENLFPAGSHQHERYHAKFLKRFSLLLPLSFIDKALVSPFQGVRRGSGNISIFPPRAASALTTVLVFPSALHPSAAPLHVGQLAVQIVHCASATFHCGLRPISWKKHGDDDLRQN